MIHLTRPSARALVVLLAAAVVAVTVAFVTTGSRADAASSGAAPPSTAPPTAPPAGSYADMTNDVDITTDGSMVTSLSVDCRIGGQVFGIVEDDDMQTPVSTSGVDFDTMTTVLAPYEHPQAMLHVDAHMTTAGLTGTVSSPANSPVRCDTVQFTASPTT